MGGKVAHSDQSAGDERSISAAPQPLNSPAPTLIPSTPQPLDSSAPAQLFNSSALPSPRRYLSSLQIAGAFILIFAVMGWIEFGGPAILDNDGYYHIRWAAMLRESFPHLPSFKVLPLTTLDEEHYVDHHYLFHVLLIRFTFGDLRMG